MPSTPERVSAYRSLAWQRSAIEPATALPFMIGATALCASFALSLSSWWPWAIGAACVVGSGIRAAWRSQYWFEQFSHQAQSQEQEAAAAAHTQALAQLAERLVADNDERTQVFLKDLQAFARQCEELKPSLESDVLGRRIIGDLEALIACGMTALKNAADLWDEVQTLATDTAREPLLEQRATLITEIETTLATVSEQVASLRQRTETTTDNEDPAQRMAALRDQLAQNLEVARRVDERMAALHDHSPSITTQSSE